jgi:hypothetical protein
MKKRFLLPLLLFLMSVSSYAQNSENRWSIGVFVGKNEYDGDFGNGIMNPDIAFYPCFALSVNRYLTPSFDAVIFGSYGEYGYYKSPEYSFLGMKTDGSLLLYYKLANGHIFRKDARLCPFFAAGLGVATYNGSRIKGGMDLTLPVGGGLRYSCNRNVVIQYQMLMYYTNNDNHDGFVNGHKEVYATHTVGVVITLNILGGKHAGKTWSPEKCSYFKQSKYQHDKTKHRSRFLLK